jgi:uracil-DNA glycosylase
VADRPIVWSRRNGPWRRSSVLWVGAAPGNAGGLGSGDMGAHGTRIPFGGDIAGGNLDVLLSAIGLSRNDTFIVASLNQLPARGGGEPSRTELAEPVGGYPDSVALLRDTVIATGPQLVVALGNVALRVLFTALTRPDSSTVGAERASEAPLRLPTPARLAAHGFVRGELSAWPETAPLDDGFVLAWRDAWAEDPDFRVIPLLHPSAQNMSPFAGADTVFHGRMVETVAALRRAAGRGLRLKLPRMRPNAPTDGIYALPEYRSRVAERHARYDDLWRRKGV